MEKLIYKDGTEIKGNITVKNGNVTEVELDAGGIMFLETDSLTVVQEEESKPVEVAEVKQETKAKPKSRPKVK